MNIIENNDTTKFFYQQATWLKPTALSKKMFNLLDPDGMSYYSPLHPIFSFAVEDRFLLQPFKHILLRDGLYPLLRFFYLNKRPHKADPFYLVDADFHAIVPPEWNEKVIFFKKSLLKKPKTIKANKLLLCFNVMPFSIQDDFYLKSLEKIISKQSEPIEELFLYFSSQVPLGEENQSKNKNCHFLAMQKILEFFKASNIKVLNWNQLMALNVQNLPYHIINPLKFYFSDSYINHDLSQRGGIDLEANLYKETQIFYPTSENYGFELYQRSDLAEKNNLFHEVCRQVESLLGLQIYEKNESRDLEKVQFSTKEFKSLAWSVAKKISHEAH